LEPVTFAVSGEASNATSVATSLGGGEVAGRHGCDYLLADGVGGAAGGGGDGGGDAVLAEPEVGRDRAGRDAVDADAFRPELLGERFGEVEECGFGAAGEQAARLSGRLTEGR
jgi:hypothetical protein